MTRITVIGLPRPNHEECPVMGPSQPMNEALIAVGEKEDIEAGGLIDAMNKLEKLYRLFEGQLESRRKAFIAAVEAAQPELKDKHWHLDWEAKTFQLELPAGQSVVRRPDWVDEILKESENEVDPRPDVQVHEQREHGPEEDLRAGAAGTEK